MGSTGSMHGEINAHRILVEKLSEK